MMTMHETSLKGVYIIGLIQKRLDLIPGMELEKKDLGSVQCPLSGLAGQG